MVGGSGSDAWIQQASAVNGQQLRFDAGVPDDGASNDDNDLFINWAAHLRGVIFDGGAGDDVFQNGGLNTSDVTVSGGTGNDLVLNLGTGATEFLFDAGDGDDIFENRGRSNGTLRMIGERGLTVSIRTPAQRSTLSSTVATGRHAAHLQQHHGPRRSDRRGRHRYSAEQRERCGTAGTYRRRRKEHAAELRSSDRDAENPQFRKSGGAGAFDTLLNSGNTIGLVDVQSGAAATLISSGNDIVSIVFSGGGFNDVGRISGRNVQSVIMTGHGGDDSLLLDVQSNVGSSMTFVSGDGDDLLMFRGTTDGLLFEGGTGDDQAVLAGTVNSAILRGGSGDDLYRFVGQPAGSIVLDEVFTGTATQNDLSSDTLDFSSFSAGAVALDLALITPQPQPGAASNLILTLTDALGLENVIGSPGADTILGNARGNVLNGAQFLASGTTGGQTPVARTKTQWVLLDFVSRHDPGEHAYSTAEMQDVKSRIEAAYTGFDVRFVLHTSDLPGDIASDPSQYATILFNQTPSSGRPGGEASEIDFGNINPGGIGTVQINGMLGGREVLEPGLKAVASPDGTADGDLIQAPDLPKPESTIENFVPCPPSSALMSSVICWDCGTTMRSDRWLRSPFASGTGSLQAHVCRSVCGL